MDQQEQIQGDPDPQGERGQNSSLMVRVALLLADAERARADAAERAVLVERERAERAEARDEKRVKDFWIANRLTYDDYARKEHRLRDEISGRDHLIGVLWKSRRMWQELSIADAHDHAG